MKTCICDLCRQRIADRHFKFKLYNGVGWYRLDVCKLCYEEHVNLYKMSQHKTDSIEAES